ncbi:DNA polymerase zeta catalytic subunit isoform X2 [Daucus carota subsp. sativus]|uniref:DNA polymerase zeta catalytic subunit isoform X2 n=1 Tax=Daucus carota subsp. sativus TaxID=79200 RepID=UPI0007EF4048|nr:PREDICTED: DNA polymerase zeta catalytic subunit isoform X2 [Daucus carota subsp. sativus]
MEESDKKKIFSVRIVSIDYYMSPPITDMDISYSSFQGGRVKEVPVIRIYGSTPAAQKTCLHIHQALPYLYVPCSELSLRPELEGEACMHSLCLAIEKALKLKGNAGSKRQHVHGCSVVQARRLYGYKSSEEFFVKIFLYYPQDVSRAANLLVGGAILDKVLQPHESHIPFLLQFLIDHNLYGMGHLHVSKMKFRTPVPDGSQSEAKGNRHHRQKTDSSDCFPVDSLVESSGNACFGLPLWTSLTIPDGWLWQQSSQLDPSIGPNPYIISRQSTCQLEGDASVHEILNQQNLSYSSLSQTGSDVKFVQSLIPIWEEFEKAGMHGVASLSIPGKPLPEDTLRILSDGGEFVDKYMELFSNTSTQIKDHITIFSDDANVDESNRVICESSPYSKAKNSAGLDLCAEKLLADKVLSTVGPSNVKSADYEAEALLKWLASSQAAEDINSDDELARETILSPLLPASTMVKMLERANIDYESQSQQECQDILDCVEDSIDIVASKRKESRPIDDCQLPLKENITRAEGSNEERILISCSAKSSEIETNSEFEKSLQSYTPVDFGSGFTTIQKRKRPLQRSGSFSMDQKLEGDIHPEISNENCFGVNNEIKRRNVATGCEENDLECSEETSVNIKSSMRDLMRRKRCYQVGLPECDTSHERVSIQEELKKDASLCIEDNSEDLKHRERNFSQQTAIVVRRTCEAQPKSGAAPVEPDNFRYGILPLLSHSDHSGPLTITADGSCFGDINDPKVTAPTARSGNRYLGSMAIHEHTKIASQLVDSENQNSAAELGSFENKTGEDLKDVSKIVTPLSFSRSDPCCRKLNFDDDILLETEKVLPTAAVCSSQPCTLQPQNIVFDNHGHFSGSHSTNPLQREMEVSAENPSGLDLRITHINTRCSSSGQHDSHSSLADARRDLGPHEDAIIAHVKQPIEESHTAGLRPLHSDSTKMPNNDVTTLIIEQNTCYAEDTSQISAPDGKSKLTPTSQIGFQDPASAGGSQQLTIFSIEVQAQSKGDSRPDPRLDAINFIVLVIFEDDGSLTETHVLLHSDTAPAPRNLDGISGCKMLVFSEEKELFNHFIKFICSYDPDILMGWDIQGGSLGFLAERAAQIGIGLLNKISRTVSQTKELGQDSDVRVKSVITDALLESTVADSAVLDDAIIEDEWGRTHASGIHVSGRIILNCWRLVRSEVKLNMYTAEAVAEEVLRQKLPFIPCKELTKWFSSGPGRARYRCIEYIINKAKLNIEIMTRLDMINRTSELARVFGIDFFSVLSRGSQYRVESMLLRLAHTQNYLAIAPGSQQVASQPAMECLPLVMEPESGFYADPVVVLDFQSLYPSMIIAYNLCFCTCLGKVTPAKSNTLGVSSYSPDPNVLMDLKDEILLTPNGVMYVPSKVRKGVLPRLLEEILSTRIMVKQAMKKLAPSERVRERIFNARQLALKLIANVTYGYTAAGFSGRMPCAELADSIVQCGRRTLETAISFVNAHEKWKAKVLYGDTDSMFVLLRGRSVKEALEIGQDIASTVTAMNPNPVTLKLEKVYHPCFLLTKKRYVGYSYESPYQVKPIFDAKGIETVRRDTCGAVSKTMEQSLRLFFEHQNLFKVKHYLLRQWKRILSGRVSLQDFVFAKEVRLGTYSSRASSLPPAAIVATKAMKNDPRAEPRYAERIPYVVVHGEPGARLVDMVIDPLELLAINSPFKLNGLYYIKKQMIPALQRVFTLVGADLNLWFQEMPRPEQKAFGKHQLNALNPNRTRIDSYYLSKHCILCGELVQASTYICGKCSKNEAAVATAMVGRTSKLEREIQHLADICRHCGGGDWIIESGVKCTSLACSVFFERRKVQKELQSLSVIAADADFYPRCIVEWF